MCVRILNYDGSGTQNQSKNGFKTLWTRDFFIYNQIFGIYDDFSKVSHHLLHAPLWKIIIYAKNWAKNEEQAYS